MLPKLPIITKNASNKSCSKLNFLQISQGVHMSISSKSETSGLQRCAFMKYDNALKWENLLNFLQISHGVHMSISSKSETSGLQRCAFMKYDNALKWENLFYGWTLPKLQIIIKMFQIILVQN